MELLHLTNDTRREEGLSVLERSRCAENAAIERATALVGLDLEHAPLAPVIEDCAPLSKAAENLVDSGAQPPEVVEAWMNSPGHRNNILDPDVTEIGIGCVEHAEALLCSQIFLGP